MDLGCLSLLMFVSMNGYNIQIHTFIPYVSGYMYTYVYIYIFINMYVYTHIHVYVYVIYNMYIDQAAKRLTAFLSLGI